MDNLVFEVGGRRILDGISLELETGQILSVMGGSGSGKTTLLKMMIGLLRPTSGRIVIDGEDTMQMSEKELDQARLKMGMVFQYAALLDSLSVYDNIVFGLLRHKKMERAAVDKLVKHLLEQVQLEEYVARQMPAELSGGMQKRVGLARALAMQPSFLFYDEPTSGLDPVTSLAIDQLIMQTRDAFQVTSVVVSHQISSVFRISDRIALLHKGKMCISGTPEEVKASADPDVQQFLQADNITLTHLQSEKN